MIFLLAPIFMTVPYSLSDKRYLSLPEGSLSLKPFESLFSESKWFDSMLDSGLIAVGATLIAIVLGTSCAVGLWRLQSPLVNAIRALAITPLLLPQILSALAFYRLFVDLRIIDTYMGVVLAHGIMATPLVLITVSTSLASFDPQLERAALGLGATPFQTIHRIIIPNVMPGILSGSVLAFLTSWDELIVTLFITGARIVTLPRRIWAGLRDDSDPVIAACATLLIMITVLVITAYFMRSKIR
jgi:putative spermidine/putrescine transport system permease protein